ncbi:MAG TPA: hypothetical protein VM536_07060 [Chloroflexia bacterium]|nr:hypothetical protein [Chloroflexia bacterium]
MHTSCSRRWAAGILLWLIGLVTTLAATPAMGAPAALTPVVAPSAQAEANFQRVWARTDWPVALKLVPRGWTWGPAPLDTRTEPYAEGAGGSRQVQYYDKARMEINDPNADPSKPWFVSNGLLVVEMVGGQIQVGNTSYTPQPASLEVVAGDARSANPDAPSYATMRGVASITGDHTFPDRTGQPVNGYMDARGAVARSDTLLGYNVRFTHYVPQSQHNIADRFWSYLQQSAPVYRNERLVTEPLYDWLYLTGYPISEPYWVTARIGGTPYAVLVQLFQRRVLTYTPAFPPQWQVQMGNVGQHYHAWRYGR